MNPHLDERELYLHFLNVRNLSERRGQRVPLRQTWICSSSRGLKCGLDKHLFSFGSFPQHCLILLRPHSERAHGVLMLGSSFPPVWQPDGGGAALRRPPSWRWCNGGLSIPELNLSIKFYLFIYFLKSATSHHSPLYDVIKGWAEFKKLGTSYFHHFRIFMATFKNFLQEFVNSCEHDSCLTNKQKWVWKWTLGYARGTNRTTCL